MAAKGKKGDATGPGPEIVAVIEQAAALAKAQPITKTELTSLYKDDTGYADELASTTGELRQRIKQSVDEHHLNKKGYAHAKRFARYKSNEKLAADFRDMLGYMHSLGVFKRIASVPELKLEGGAEDKEPARSGVGADVIEGEFPTTTVQ